MKPSVYFKLQAKNLFKDYQTKKPHVDEALGITYFDYTPKYFDIDRIFNEYDWDEDNFSLMKAQHLFALLLGFEKWTDLAKASDEELELAKLVWDNQHKIGLDDWQSYIAGVEADNTTTFDAASRIEIFKRVFVEVDGHHSMFGDYRLNFDFGKWLLQQVDRDDHVGDLAKDANRDPEFPRTQEVDQIASYLRNRGAHVRGALAEAISDWHNVRRGGAAKEKVQAKSLAPEWTKTLKKGPVHAVTYKSPSGDSVSTVCRLGIHGDVARYSPLTESRSQVTCAECSKMLAQNGWNYSQSGLCADCDNFPHEGHRPDCVFVRRYGCSTAPSPQADLRP